MADENFQSITFNAGRLVKNPTASPLTSDFPYGGTALGIVRDVVAIPTQVIVPIRAEEFGHQVVEVVEGGRSWVVGGVTRGWDNDMKATLFPRVTNFGRGIKESLTNPRAGGRLSDRAVKLLFVPDDTERHRFLLLYRACPLIEEQAELALQLSNEFQVPFMFMAIPNASGDVIAHELKQDLVL